MCFSGNQLYWILSDFRWPDVILQKIKLQTAENPSVFKFLFNKDIKNSIELISIFVFRQHQWFYIQIKDSSIILFGWNIINNIHL